MKTMRRIGIGAVTAALVWVGAAWAGNLTPPGAPGSTMHTLEDIYQKVTHLGPAQTLSDTTTVVQAGSYASTTLETVDPDMVASNIRAGVVIFGITGTYELVDTNLAAGLVAYYPFNGNANDESGNALHATVNGAVLTADRFGTPNSAYYFNDYANIFRDAFVSTNPSLSVSAWFKTDPDETQGRLVEHVWGTGAWLLNYYNLAPTGSVVQGNFLGVNWPANTNEKAIIQAEGVRTSVWEHAVIQFDGQADLISIYLNGVLSHSAPVSWQLDPNINRLYIGGQTQAAEYFKGCIDSVRVYDRALSADEIWAIYNMVE